MSELDPNGVEAAATAIVGAEVGYEMKLSRLVDGVSTYTLKLETGEQFEFGNTDEVYEKIAGEKAKRQAEAAITAYLSTVSPLSDGDGYIAGNGEQTRWRAWEAGECMWTEDPAKATRFARREDAEAVHYDDDAVWCIKLLSEALPAPTPPTVNSGDKTR